MQPELKSLLAALGALAVSAPALANIDIRFDYSYDSNGFFDSAERRAVLDQAAATYESFLIDQLTPFSPDAGDDYTLLFCDPSNPAGCSDPGSPNAIGVTNYRVATNEIVIFVGATQFANANQLGQAGPGGISADVSSVESALNFLCRGQMGGCPGGGDNDFGPWGGTISFARDADWYFDTDLATDDIPDQQFDFYSAAVHELGHVFGLGNANSWKRLLSYVGTTPFFDGVFTGRQELFADAEHWLPGTRSTIFGVGSFDTAYDPFQERGRRNHMTDLDYAALQDMGWEIAPVPEPRTWGMMLAGAGLLGFMARRRKQRG